MPSLIHEEDIKLLLTIHTQTSYKMTTTTLPKLNWTEYLALHDSKRAEAAERRSRSEETKTWTVTEYASNGDALTVTSILIFRAFNHVDPSLYADPEIRKNVIELLTEAKSVDPLISSARKLTSTIKRLQSI